MDLYRACHPDRLPGLVRPVGLCRRAAEKGDRHPQNPGGRYQGDRGAAVQGVFYLVLLATLLAFPLAWYARQAWLQHFAYRIAMPLEVFVIAGLAAAGLAFGTVSFQALRAANANPVRNLRIE